MLKKLARRLRRYLRAQRYPRTVTLTTFDDAGIDFHLTNATEAYRVEKLGGETAFLSKLLQDIEQDELLWDVGACVGVVALHASAKGADVVAFEPDPSFREHLEENLTLNPRCRIDVHPWAVTDAPGETTLFTDGADGLSPSLQEDSNRDEVTVETVCGDELVFERGFRAPDVVKLDIEGAEALALEGMQTLLGSEQRPRAIYLEIHPDFLPSFGATEEEVLDRIEDCGYEAGFRQEREEQIHYVFRDVA